MNYPHRHGRGKSWFWRLGLSALILSGISGLAATRAAAQDRDGAGLVVSGKATAEDVGLPIYPGATPYKGSKDESDAARVGLWGGALGFKLAALKMTSSDAPAQVADYYKKALAKYGNVLDCTNAAAADQGKDSSRDLTCDGDKPNKGGMLFKAGTKEKQHIVAIDPNGRGTTFALVYLWVKGD